MSDLELIKKYIPENLQSDAIKKLNTGYPVQYIIGNVEFYGNIISVDENVLIPRFETEYLVEKTLNYLKKINKEKINILEIGTGSGCISIALKKNIDCNIKAIDISKKAISIAKKNAFSNNVNIDFECIDINDYEITDKYDLVISNPPYVPYNSLVDEKIKYEPQNAIYAEDNGLYFYKIILNKIKNSLNKDYLVAFEIGENQGEILENISREIFPKDFIIYESDYNGYDRYFFISNINLK